MDKVLHSSKKHDHQTPRYVLDLVRAVAPIVYDPCTSDQNNTEAAYYSTPEGTYLRGGEKVVALLGGLEMDWTTFSGLPGQRFVNPPYGRALGPWSRKIVSCDDETTVLVPARVETKWFRRLQSWCTWRCDWSSPTSGSRLKFLRPDGERQDTAPFPSTIFYKGPNGGQFCRVFSPHGTIVPGDKTLKLLLRLASESARAMT